MNGYVDWNQNSDPWYTWSPVSTFTTGSGETGTGFLSFPLEGYTPYDARVTAVLDRNGREPGVVAYNGEEGSVDPYTYAPGVVGFKKSDGQPFDLPLLNYDDEVSTSRKDYLFYDNYRGYDYAYDGIDGTSILAAADGVLCVATSQTSWDGTNLWADRSKCPVIGGDATLSWDTYHTFYIIHPNGYSTWYLHASDLEPSVRAAIINNGYAEVGRQQVVAYVGDFGVGGFVHLHFAVRQGENLVDPYGDGSADHSLILWEDLP